MAGQRRRGGCCSIIFLSSSAALAAWVWALGADELHSFVVGGDLRGRCTPRHLRARVRLSAGKGAEAELSGVAGVQQERQRERQREQQPRRWLLEAGLTLGLSCAGAALAVAGPIVVLGANGRTGRQCVRALLQRGEQVVATSRTGEFVDAGSCSPVACRVARADVTQPDSIKAVVAGARGVIFAASQSKEGGSAKAVDNLGLVSTAEACIEAKVKRLVVVSSGGVSRPDSPVYQFLNLFGNIMAEKIAGEDRVRALYASLPGSEIGYTVVRPGGLTDEPARGAAAVELGQGDGNSGRISREDVASLSIAAVDSEAARNATFECYYADTAKPLASVGLSNILGQTTPDSGVAEGRKGARGATWEALLGGVARDAPAA